MIRKILRSKSCKEHHFSSFYVYAYAETYTPVQEEGGSRKPMDEQALRTMSTEILTDIKEWRRAHPRATYVEIEDEVHKRMMQLEARVIEGAVAESPHRAPG